MSTAAPLPERIEAVTLFYPSCLNPSYFANVVLKLLSKTFCSDQAERRPQGRWRAAHLAGAAWLRVVTQPAAPLPPGCRVQAAAVSALSAAAEPAAQDPRGSSRHVPSGSAPEGGAASGQSRDLDPGPAPGGRALDGELVLALSSACPGVGRPAGVRPESRAEGRSEKNRPPTSGLAGNTGSCHQPGL